MNNQNNEHPKHEEDADKQPVPVPPGEVPPEPLQSPPEDQKPPITDVPKDSKQYFNDKNKFEFQLIRTISYARSTS